MYSNFESTVEEIIEIDRVLFSYEEVVGPADPPEGAGMVAIERSKTASKEYRSTVELQNKNVRNCMGYY